MQGSLSPGALPGLLRALYVGRRTGLLHVSRGDQKRNVRFRHGHIVAAGSSQGEEHLGELLVREGWITHQQLVEATAAVKAGGVRLGEALLRGGALDPGRLDDALALHVRHVMHAAFSSNEGEFAFEDLPEPPPDAELTLKVSTGELILETVRSLDEALVHAALGNTDRVLAVSGDPLLRFQNVALTPADGYVLSRVDGVISAREVIEMTGLPSPDVERSLYGLLCTGIIEYVPGQLRGTRGRPRPAGNGGVDPPAPAVAAAPAAEPREPAGAPPSGAGQAGPVALETRRREIVAAYEGRARNHFEVLGITRSANEQQVKEAYFSLARRFHPDAHHDPQLDDLRDKLEAVFIRLGEAYEKLRNPRTRGQYESDLAAREPRRPSVPTAEGATPAGGAAEPERATVPPPDPAFDERSALEAVRRAEKLMADQKFFDVIQTLEPILDALGSKKRVRARLLLAAAYARNPNWTRQAENQLKMAVTDDAKSVEAHFQLADFYRRQGLKSRSGALYRRVLELNPEHEEAQAGLLETDPGGEPAAEPPRGLLKRIFGKD